MKFSKFIINILFIIFWTILISSSFPEVDNWIDENVTRNLPSNTDRWIKDIFEWWGPICIYLGSLFGGAIFFSRYLWFSNSKSKKQTNADELKKSYLLNNRSYVLGSMFGGGVKSLKKVADDVEDILVNEMIGNDYVNNEQIASVELPSQRREFCSLRLQTVYFPFNSITSKS